MIIQPKIRGFICTNAHPEGCARQVGEQIRYIKEQPKLNGPKRVLVIGASTGFGLASRIAAAFGFGADTLGVFFERPAEKDRTASAGWYNTAALEAAARAEGLVAESINGNAFSDEIKQETIALIKEKLGQVDLVVYSLASPRRTHPKTGEAFTSVIKPIGGDYENKTVNFMTGAVSTVSVAPATEDEIRQTIAVMGGEDWQFWIEDLLEAGVLAEGAKTVAYSYIGPQITYPIYREGTIGRSKDDLEAKAHQLNDLLRGKISGSAFVSVNKALVTQSSSAIPIVPLYISLLFKVMKEKGLHEGTIEQMYRLYADRLYATDTPVDETGRIRIDDWEMREDVQSEVAALWEKVDADNLGELADLEGYRNDFLHLFGFGVPDLDYAVEVEPNVPLTRS
ncbi:enoyl-ACP reductase FabV [Gorillibacterium timonense]|uniref:enoyl-ACP reductase FabV n=1 Tax=Gorillibacterium timonense TaxID=1689269 RepID=UPI00071C4E02|nr:enoyl-ACP reductase FabV [Gorillibacterium timonense]